MRERLLNYSHHLRRLRLMVLVAVLAVPIGAAGQLTDPNDALNLDFKNGLSGWKLYHGVVKYGQDAANHTFCWNYEKAQTEGVFRNIVTSSDYKFLSGYGYNCSTSSQKGSVGVYSVSDIFSGGVSGNAEGESFVSSSGNYYWGTYDSWKGSEEKATLRRFNVWTKGSESSAIQYDMNFAQGSNPEGSDKITDNQNKEGNKIKVTGDFMRACQIGTSHGVSSGRACELQYYGNEQGCNSAKLNKETYNNKIFQKHVSNAEMMEYEFLCTDQMGMLVVDYCAVAMNPTGHSGPGVVAKPLYMIKAQFYNEDADQWIDITCGSTVKNTDQMKDSEGKLGSSLSNDHLVSTNWESVAFDLTEKDEKGAYKYVGKKIRLQAYVTDCCYGSVSDAGGHACYMYFRAEVKPLKIDVEFCKSNEPVTITAPAGYDSYTWYQMGETDVWNATMQSNDDIKGNKWELGAGSVGSSNNHFHVTMKMNSTGCPIELDTIISPTDLLPNFTPKYGCNRYVDFVDASTSESASGSGASDSVVIWNWTVFPAGADPVINGVKQSAANAVYYAVDKDANGSFLFHDADGKQVQHQSTNSKRNYGSVLDAEGQWVVMEVKTVSGCEGLICKKIVPRFVPVNTVVIKNACLYSPVFGTVKNVPVNYADWQNLDDAYFKPGVGRPTEAQVKAEGFNASNYLRNDYLYYLKNNISYSFDEGATWVSRMEGGTQVDIDPEAVRAGNIVRKFLVKDTWEDESGKENYCIYNVNTEYEVYEVPNALPIATDNVGLTRVKEGVMKTETATIRYSEWQVGVCKDKSVTLHLECDGKYGLTWSDGTKDDMSYSNILNGSYETNNKTLAKGTHSVDMSNGNCMSRIYVSVVEGSQDVKLEVGPAVCAPGPVEASLVNIEKGYVEWGKLVSAIDDQGNAIQKEEQLAAGEYEFALGEADFTSQYYAKGTDDKGCSFNIPFMFNELPAARPDFTFTFRQTVPDDKKKSVVITPNAPNDGDPMTITYDPATRTYVCSPICGYNSSFNDNCINVAVKNPNTGAKNCYLHYTWYKNTGIVPGKDENVWRTHYQAGNVSNNRDLYPSATASVVDEYTLVVTSHTFDDAKTVICEEVYTIKIESLPTPTASFVLEADGDGSYETDRACVGSNVTLTAVGASDKGIKSYTWYDPTKPGNPEVPTEMLKGQTNGTLAANAITYKMTEGGNAHNSGNGLYSFNYGVRVEDEKGCVGVYTKTVYVKPLPKFVVSDAVGCPNEFDAKGNVIGTLNYVTLEAKDLAGGSYSHSYNNIDITKGYLWGDGNGFDISDGSNKKDILLTAKSGEPQTVKVSAKASNGCVSTVEATVSAYPRFDIELDAIRPNNNEKEDVKPGVDGKVKMCAKSTAVNYGLILRVAPKITGEALSDKFTYKVERARDGKTFTSAATEAGSRVNVKGFTLPTGLSASSEKFYVTVTSSDGCVERDTFDLIIMQRPSLTLSSDRSVACENGEKVTITARDYSTPLDKIAKMVWIGVDDGNQRQDGNVLTGDVFYSDDVNYTTYKAVVTTVEGCFEEKSINIYNGRSPLFDVVAEPDALCEGAALNTTLKATSSYANTKFYTESGAVWSKDQLLTPSSSASYDLATGEMVNGDKNVVVKAGNTYIGPNYKSYKDFSDIKNTSEVCYAEKTVTVTSKPVPVVEVKVLNENKSLATQICNYSEYYLEVSSELANATDEMINVKLDINGVVETDSKLESVPANGSVVIGPFSPVNNSADVVNFKWNVVGGECGGSDKTEVKIVSRPIVNILVSGDYKLENDVYKVCENTKLTLSNAYDGRGTYKYVWTSGNNTWTTKEVTDVIPVAGVSDEFKLVVTDEAGCQSEMDKITVDVAESPKFTALATLDPMCEGCQDTIMVSDNNNMQNGYIYKIYRLDENGDKIESTQEAIKEEFVKTTEASNEDGSVTSVENTYYIYKTPAIGVNTSYMVEAVGGVGCLSSQKVAVNVSNAPQLEVYMYNVTKKEEVGGAIKNGGTVANVCPGDKVRFQVYNRAEGTVNTTYSFKRVTPGYEYTWTTKGTATGTTTAYTTSEVSIDREYKYEIKATSQDGCVSYFYVTVPVWGKDEIYTLGNYASSNVSYLCQDFNGELTIECFGGKEGGTYAWKASGQSLNGNESKIKVTPRGNPASMEQTSTSYTVTADNKYGCPQTVTHTVYFRPLPNFAVKAESEAVCEDDEVKISAYKVVGDGSWHANNSTSYTYSFDGSAYSTAANNSYKFTDDDKKSGSRKFVVSANYNVITDRDKNYVSCQASKEITVDVIYKPEFEVEVLKNNEVVKEGEKLCVDDLFSFRMTEKGSVRPAGYSDIVTYEIIDESADDQKESQTLPSNFGDLESSAAITADKTRTFLIKAKAAKGCGEVVKRVTVSVEQPFDVRITSEKMNGTGVSEVCSGGSLKLKALCNATLWTGNGDVYKWNTGGNAESIEIKDVRAEEKYTVQVRNANGCWSNVAEHTVTTNPVPVAGVTGEREYCVGSKAEITAASTVSSGSILRNTWMSVAAGTNGTYGDEDDVYEELSNGSVFDRTVTEGSNKFALVVETDKHCSDAVIFDVTGRKLPEVVVHNLTRGSSTVLYECIGTAMTLEAKNNNSSVNTFKWFDVSGSQLGTGSSIIVTPKSTNDVKFVVEVEDGSGCVAKKEFSYGGYSVPNLNVVGNTSCEGSSETLTAEDLRFGDFETKFYWNNATESNHEFDVKFNVGSGPYMVVAIDKNKCRAEEIVELTVNANPTATIEASASQVCAGGTIELSAKTSVETVQWYEGVYNNDGTVTWSQSVYSTQKVITPVVDKKKAYKFTAMDGKCSTESEEFTVSPYDMPSFKDPVNGVNVCANETEALITIEDAKNISKYYYRAKGGEFKDTESKGAPSFSVPITSNEAGKKYFEVYGESSNGCRTDIKEFAVNVNSIPTVSVDVISGSSLGNGSAIRCASGDPLVFEAKITSGQKAESFFWDGATVSSGVSSQASFTGTASREIYVTIKDDKGCEGKGSIWAEVKRNPEISLAPVSNVAPDIVRFCAGSDVMLAVKTIQQEAKFASYSWKVGGNSLNWSQSSQVIKLEDGKSYEEKYSVIVKDDYNCESNEASYTVKVEKRPTITVDEPEAVCPGNVVSVTLKGADSYFDGEGNPLGGNVYSETLYQDKVFEFRGVNTLLDQTTRCLSDPIKVSATVRQAPTVSISEARKGSNLQLSSNPITACENDELELSAVVSGGTGTYVYTWDGNASADGKYTPKLSGGGTDGVYTYTVVVKDNGGNGCPVTAKVNFKANAIPNVTITADKTAVCTPADVVNLKACLGDAACADGAQGKYAYNWMVGDKPYLQGEVQSMEHTNVTEETEVFVTVTEVSTGCVSEKASITINKLPAPQFKIIDDASQKNIFDADYAGVKVCEGEFATLVVVEDGADALSGAVWKNGDDVLSNAPTFNTPLFEGNAKSAYYKVEVTGSNGCVAEKGFSVNVKPTPQLTLSGPVDPKTGRGVSMCEGTEVLFKASSTSSGDVQFNWIEPMSTDISTGKNEEMKVDLEGSEVRVKLTATLNGCSVTKDSLYTIYENPAIDIETDAENTANSVCENTAVQLKAVNGSPSLSGKVNWQWQNDKGIPFSTNAVTSAIPAKGKEENASTTSVKYALVGTVNYSGKATCKATKEVTITVIKNPEITVNFEPSQSVCSSEKNVKMILSGANYYSWNKGAAYDENSAVELDGSVVAIGSDYVSGTVNDYSIEGMEEHKYTNGTLRCISKKTVGLKVYPAPSVNISAPAVSCPGETITLIASGAESYQWIGSGTLADGTEMNKATSDIVKLVPVSDNQTYNYSVVGTQVVDNSLATPKTCSTKVDVDVKVLPRSKMNILGQKEVCIGDKAELKVEGVSLDGKQPYVDFVWSSGEKGDVISHLIMGDTKLIVTGRDTNNCFVDESVEIKAQDPDGFEIKLDENVKTTVCENEPVTLKVTGASNYKWEDNPENTNSEMTVSPVSNTTYTVEGTYGVCTKKLTIPITVVSAPAITIVGSTVVCRNNVMNLQASSQVNGLVFKWEGANAEGADLSVVPEIDGAKYKVVATDPEKKHCESSKTVTVTLREKPTVKIAGDLTVCENTFGDLKAEGAVSYVWGYEDSNGRATNVAGGANYQPKMETDDIKVFVSGTDSYGCVGEAEVEVLHVAPPEVSITGSDKICAGEIVSLTAGGNAETYVWNGKDTANSVTETLETSKTYYLKGISTEGCVAEASKLVTAIQNPILSLSGNTTLCQGDMLKVQAHGADSYIWNDGSSPSEYPDSMSMVMPNAGVRQISVTGKTGDCQTTRNFEINVKKAPTVQIVGDVETCANVALPLEAVSDDEITSYTWTNNLNAVSLSGQKISPVISKDVTYVVRAGNIYGCAGTADHPIRVVSSPDLAVSADIEFGNPNVQTTLEFNNLGVAYVDVCDGSKLNLQVRGAKTFSWDHKKGIDSSYTSLDTTITSSATFVVTGYITGCDASRTIVVGHKTNPSIDVIGKRVVCEGSPVTLEPVGTDSFLWNGKEIVPDENGKKFIEFTPVVKNFKYTLVGIDTVNNCQTVRTYTDISFNSKPEFTVSGEKEVCVNESITLNASAVDAANDEGNYSYNWGFYKDAKKAIDLDSELEVTAFEDGVDEYFASVKDSVGCVDTVLFSVRKKPLPVLTFDAKGCDNNDATPEVIDICMKNDLYAYVTGGGASIVQEDGTVSAVVKDKPVKDTIYKVTGVLNGCKSVLEIPVRTIPSPIVYLTNYAEGEELSYCEGTPVKLIVGGNAVSYTMPDGSKGTNGTVYVDSKADGLMSYFITGEGDNGCSVQEEFTFKMNELPDVAIDIAKDQDRICYREVAELYVSGAESYKWSTGSRKDTIRATITKDSVFTVVGRDGNGCESKVSFNVTMVELPVLEYKGETEFCDGNTATLRGSGTGTGGGDYYAWSIGKDTIAIGNQATTTLNGNTTYTLWGKSKEGCISSLDVDIVAKEAPIMFWEGEYELNATADSILLCQKQTLDITMKGAESYQWTGGNTSDRLQVVPTKSTHYTVTGTGANGCKTTKAINVKVLPTPSIKIEAPNFVCVGEDFQMKVTEDTKGSFESFAWSNHSTEATSGDLIMEDSDYTLKVTGYTSLNCPAEASFTVKPKSLPNLFVRGTKEICKGSVFALHGQGANEYAWFMDENAYYGNDTVKTGDQISFEATTDEVLVMSGTLNGCTDTIHVPLSVQTPPILHTEGLKPICQGEVLELVAKATNVNDDDKVEFSWSTGTVSGEYGDTMRMTPLSSQDVYLTGSVVLIDENGDQIFCKNTLDIPVTVNPKPTIEVEGERNVCYGSEAELTAVGAAAYEWETLNSSSATVRPTIVSDTTFVVRGKVVETGCDAQAVVKVKVKPLPVLGVAEGSKVVLCDGEEADITMFGAATYGWRQPDGSLVAGNRYKHTPTQDTIYRVVGTSNNNCVDSMDIEVSVNMLPSLSYSGNSEICAGDSLKLFAHSAPEGCTFTWSNGNSGEMMVAKPLVSAGYSLTGKDANGCFSTIEIPVTVNQRTPVDIDGTARICAGAQAEIGVKNADEFVAFNWSNGNVGSTIRPDVDEKTIFSVDATDHNGCVTKAEFTVDVIDIPVLSFYGDTVVCLGEEVNLLADGARDYKWKDVDGNVLSGSANYRFVPEVATKLILEGSMSNCKSERVIPIMVNAVPNLYVDMPEFICRGSVGELRATAGAGAKFLWSTGDSTSVVEVSPLKSASFTVTATNSYGCDSSVTKTVLVYDPPTVMMGTSKDEVCPNQADSVYLSATGAVSYSWSSVPAVADISIYNFDKQSFWAVFDEGEDVEVTVVGTDARGCQTTVTKTIAQRELEQIKFSINPNCIDESNPEVRFSGRVPDHEDAVWTWTPGEGLNPMTLSREQKGNVVYKYDLPLKDSFEVKVQSVDEHGCVQNGTGWVYKWKDFWAADAFTPNGDGRNDVFYFHGGEFIEDFTYIIYNRMGEVIFEGKSIEDKWDGTYKGEACPTGVYGWTVKYNNNSATLSKTGERKGMVTIVR